MSAQPKKTRLVGVNHVALEVGDIDQALDFYSALFDFELRGRTDTMAFIDMGDQFLAIAQGRGQSADYHRHFGLVVDQREPLREKLAEMGVETLPGRGLDFRDPWGNRIQVVEYRDVQFTKPDHIMHALGLGTDKSTSALAQLRKKGLEPRA